MKNVGKKLGSLFLAFAIMLTAVVCDVTPVQAAGKSSTDVLTNVYNDGGSVTGNQAILIPFTLAANNGFKVYIIAQSPVEANLQLFDSEQKALSDVETATTDMYDEISLGETNGYAIVHTFAKVSAGDYYYAMQFAQDTQVIVEIDQINTISIQPKATITAGFTKKLSVSGAKVKKWESRNKAIATVDKNGKVTAKKKGKAKIVATLADGKTKLECTVTVAENKFSETKVTLNDCKDNAWGMAAYKAVFDKKGNLVINTQVVNNHSYKRLTELRNLKIVVKDANGKTVATYKQSKSAVSVSPQSTKGYTFTIKKADLKKKKADLRNGDVVIDADGYGR